MDKAEYKIATEHIKKLISQGEYAEASHIADTIDWRRVKSVMMLCTVSDLYKVNRRYEDAKELLYMAYERNPESRTILYSLCDLSIKLEEFVAAIEYYKSFVEVAPRDSGRYVLQYRLYQAQDVSLEERIEVLEQLKREEYIEKWAYELAYLYHRIGFATKCVEECDELILWFGKGRYVYKAMELKMLHEPLTPSQQYVYDRRFEHLEQAKDMTRVLPRIDSGDSEMTNEGMVDVTDAPTVEIPQEYIEKELQQEVEEIQVKTLDVANAYNTMNLQKELAASLREILEVSHTESSVEVAITEDVESGYADTAEMSRELTADVTETAEEEAADSAEYTGWAEQSVQETNETEQEKVPVEELSEAYVADVAEDAEVSREAAEVPVAKEPAIWAEPADASQEPVVKEQITGQLSIDDILAEWDKQEEKAFEAHQEDISNRIKSQTQDIFAAIEAEMKRDLFEVAVEAEAAAGEAVDQGIEEAGESVPDAFMAAATIVDASVIESMMAEAEAIEAVEEVAEEAPETVEEVEAAIEEAPEMIEAVEEMAEEALEQGEVVEEIAAETVETGVAVEDDIAEESAASEMLEQAADVIEEADETDEVEAGEESGEAETQSEQVKNIEAEALDEDTLDEGSQAAVMNLKRYEQFIRSVDTEIQIINVLDNASMEATTGNISVTGHDPAICFDFIKALLGDLKRQGMMIRGKTAKISAVNLNKKEPSEIISKVQGGILIIERAGRLRRNIAEKMIECLQNEIPEVLIFLTDTKQGMNRFFDKNRAMYEFFNLRVDIKDYTSDELVEHGAKYALANEYSVDEMGLLALRTRVEEMISNDEALTLEDAQNIVDEAIEHANRKNFKHFMDILLHKRYDEDDMIILREEDFLYNE